MNDKALDLMELLTEELYTHALMSEEDARALIEILFKYHPNSDNRKNINRCYMKLMDLIEEYKEERRLNEPDPDFVKAD